MIQSPFLVKIKKARHNWAWYSSFIGAEYLVTVEEPHYKVFLKDLYLLKEDCEIITKTNDMSELKITKEKVLEAAAKCPTAKETLKTLFPEFFEKEALPIEIKNNIVYVKDKPFVIGVRIGGKYLNRGLFLNENYKWEIVKDEGDNLVLIAKEK